MKRKINLYLLLVIFLCFCTATAFGAGESILWSDNSGIDPATDEGWKVDKGTLEGWQESNFVNLEYQTSGVSEEVGTGITVDGIKVKWDYPVGNIGKGGDLGLDQSINYTVSVHARIPSILRMDIFGNGGRSGNNAEFSLLNGENDIPETEMDLMVFSPSIGGIVDAGWNFIELDAVDYATGMGADSYINACDLWTANLWANVPYGFSVSSGGMGSFAGLEDPLLIEMRYLERLDVGLINQESGLPSSDVGVANNSDWAGNYLLNEDGVEIGQYEAGQNAHINMQFRIPVNGAPAGRYKGEVTFSTYTI